MTYEEFKLLKPGDWVLHHGGYNVGFAEPSGYKLCLDTKYRVESLEIARGGQNIILAGVTRKVDNRGYNYRRFDLVNNKIKNYTGKMKGDNITTEVA